jgi:threonine/homoserine/homoserine lactone efflux protein
MATDSSTWAALAGLGVAHFAAVATPGPAFLTTARHSASRSFLATLPLVAGLGTAAMVWALAVLLGLSALLQQFASLYMVLRIAGGLYLLWIAFQMWRHAGDAAAFEGTTEAASAWQSFRRGFGVNIANPKVMVFFGSIFSLFLQPATAGQVSLPDWSRWAAFGVVFVNEYCVLALVALLFSTPPVRRVWSARRGIADRCSACILGSFGALLVWRSAD